MQPCLGTSGDGGSLWGVFSNNLATLSVQNRVFSSPDAASLAITSICPRTCLFQAIQKRWQDTFHCPTKDSLLYDNALQGTNILNNSQEKVGKKDIERHTHTLPLRSPPTDFLCPRSHSPPTPTHPSLLIAHTPLCPPDPSSLSIHSSRIYPASLTRHVSGQMSKKPPFSNRGEGNSSNSAQALSSQPAPRLHSPSFSCSFFSFNMLNDW